MSQSASVHRTLVFDGSPEPVRGLRAMLSTFLRDRNIDEQVGRAVVLAFSEALDNAVEHGLGHQNGTVNVKMRYTPRFILVSLRDSGFDRTPLGQPIIPGPLEERGRGFALMNKLMDYVKVKSYPNGGTRVSMLRRLDLDPDRELDRGLEQDP
jgi:anti-sigma regulatory factor (Ser/Thr protein kinase)